jgi:hypothetical protein
MVKGYKFGILYSTKGQKKENDFFQNRMWGANIIKRGRREREEGEGEGECP